jgi:hypothetical protein
MDDSRCGSVVEVFYFPWKSPVRLDKTSLNLREAIRGNYSDFLITWIYDLRYLLSKVLNSDNLELN